MKGLEPPRPETLDPKSNAATNYATCAGLRAKVGIFLEIAKFFLFGGGGSFLEHSEDSEDSECSEECGGRRTGRTGQTGQTGPAGSGRWDFLGREGEGEGMDAM